MEIERGLLSDEEGILRLYRTLAGSSFSTWDENYPNRELVKQDLREREVFVIRGEQGRILAALVSVEVDDIDHLAPWYPDVKKWIMFVRIGVDRSVQNQGLARKLVSHAIDTAEKAGYDGIRLFVSPENIPARRSYEKLGFQVCGEADHFGEHWLCYQLRCRDKR